MNPHAIGSRGLIGVRSGAARQRRGGTGGDCRGTPPGLPALGACRSRSGRWGSHDESDAALAELKKSPSTNAYYVAQLLCHSRQEESWRSSG